jgi:hypothetical protein
MRGSSTIQPQQKMKTKNMTTLPVPNLISRSPLRRGFLFIPLAIVCFGLTPAPNAFGVSPAPDGGYSSGNTAEGTNALFSRTSGVWNTALGYQALYHVTTGNQNTATGFQTLFNTTTGSLSVANGSQALFNNTTGSFNTATGFRTLYYNTIGSDNTGNGYEALAFNTTGSANTANGSGALYNNTTGYNNTANGFHALAFNTAGIDNTANGQSALYSNTTGFFNTANGYEALDNNTTGSNNIALGYLAGANLTTSDYNIDIGNSGFAGDAQTIRIGDDTHQGSTYIAAIYGVSVSGLAVAIDSSGHLGTVSSSRRFKKEIKPMDKASEAILALKPVTFRYKHQIDPKGMPQFGLVAEEVAQVDPDLVVRDAKGEIYSVRYEAVNAMLLNEFLKEHRTVAELRATVAQKQKDFQSRLAEQQKQIKALVSGLEKVSAQVEMSRPAPQMALNNQ